jgi:hypothetical protein
MPPSVRPGVLAAVAGAVAVVLLGLLTFGVQASVRPHGLPLAVADTPSSPAAQRIAAAGGEAVSWQVVTPERAARLLEDKKIYGYLTPGSPVTITESGALLPSATQAADAVLRGVATAVTGPQAPAPVVRTVHPTSAAAKTLPLAAVTLLWIGGLAGSGVLLTLARRTGRRPSIASRLLLVAGNAVLGTVLVFTFAHIWDGTTIVWNWAAVWFLVLVGGTFAALQGAVTRLLGLAGLPILGLLYLMAPSVSGQPPELLNPAYRALLWSWTPFRIASEGLRSLLYSAGVPDDAVAAWIVFPVLAVVALAVVLAPLPRRAPEHGRHRAGEQTAIVPALALELITRRIEQGQAPPALLTAAAALAPAGTPDGDDDARARAAARDVLRPAVHRALTTTS